MPQAQSYYEELIAVDGTLTTSTFDVFPGDVIISIAVAPVNAASHAAISAKARFTEESASRGQVHFCNGYIYHKNGGGHVQIAWHGRFVVPVSQNPVIKYGATNHTGSDITIRLTITKEEKT